jgi:hypothetical protein
LADIHEAGALRWASTFGVEQVGIEGDTGSTAPRRVGLLVEGRHTPLLSSASRGCEGLLVEHHRAELNRDEIPKHRHSGIGLSMQLDGSLRLQWKLGSGWQSATTGAGSILLYGWSGCNESIWTGTYDRIMCEAVPTHLANLTEGRFAGAVVDVADRWSLKDARLEHLLRVLQPISIIKRRRGDPA